MRVGRTLHPGQRGIRRFAGRYGDCLVSVCYDDARQRLLTAVERIVDEGAWVSRPETLVGVRAGWGEADVVRREKRAGGVWDARRKVWRLLLGDVRRLGVEDRLVRLKGRKVERPPPDLLTRHHPQ